MKARVLTNLLLKCFNIKSRVCQLVSLVIVLIVIILILSIPTPAPQCHRSGPREWSADGFRNFAIRSTWDGQCTNEEPARISLSPTTNGDVTVRVYAHFFNSPAKPNGPAGQPFDKLWDYEVVEVFFLNDKDQYVEVELSPYGQHLVLLLNGRRNAVEDQLPLTYSATITEDRWVGEAVIPRSYLPPGVTKFNAYAIHGEGDSRQYEALYPLASPKPGDVPDFHRLELFQPIDMNSVVSNYNPQEVSDKWRKYQS